MLSQHLWLPPQEVVLPLNLGRTLCLSQPKGPGRVASERLFIYLYLSLSLFPSLLPLSYGSPATRLHRSPGQLENL